MRRLKPRQDNERGGISVIVGLLMVVLLGFTAISVDVGMLYSEKAQLQNGADAAALLLAQRCARNPADADCSSTSTLAATLAATVASGNALDGRSNVKSLVLDRDNRTVAVTVGAQEQGKEPNKVTLFFARALGVYSSEVTASSSVEWGVPSRGDMILPLAIAQCKLNLAPGSAAGAAQVLDMDTGGCGEIPGGFGWITDSDGNCGVTLAAGQATDPGAWVTIDPGASAPAVCTASDLSRLNNQTVLLPLYDIATGTGSNGEYYIKGFAAFQVTGYHFASDSWPADGKMKNKTMSGRFVRYVSLSDALELGGTEDYGTSIVRFAQ